MNIIYFTKSKQYTLEVLQYMVQQGHNVVALVVKDDQILRHTKMEAYAKTYHIPIWSHDELYKRLSNQNVSPVDLGVSFIFGAKIKSIFLDYVQGQCINMHPAPLPEYRGIMPYNHGVFNQETIWYVTTHYVTPEYDAGDIIEQASFDIDPKTITAYKLAKMGENHGAQLLKHTIDCFAMRQVPAATPQGVGGHFYNRSDFECLKMVQPGDSAEIIERRIRATWYPPYEGAYIQIDEHRYTLVNKFLLEQLGEHYDE